MKIIIFTFFLLFSLSLTYSNNPVRIVCMGNSITQGKVINGVITQLSYRVGLWEKLDSAGVDVDMVGYTKLWFDEKKTATPTYPVSKYTFKPFDRDHDAYYGIKSDGLLNGSTSTGWTGSPLPKLADRLLTYTPDFALLHIGTNDNDTIVNTTTANIKAIIDQLRNANPNVTIFLAKLISSWKAINARMESIAAEKTTSQSPVIIVDLSTGFIASTANPNTTMTIDGLHPNPKGEKFMYDRWYKAIISRLNVISGTSGSTNNPEIQFLPGSNGRIFTLNHVENGTVKVYNVAGVCLCTNYVKNESNIKIDLSSAVKGLYIIHINDGIHFLSKKINID